jgi:hypothetical protein
MKKIAIGLENSSAKCVVFHTLSGVPRFFEYSGPSIVFLIAAAVWDSRGVLAFRATICEYGKLLF